MIYSNHRTAVITICSLYGLLTGLWKQDYLIYIITSKNIVYVNHVHSICHYRQLQVYRLTTPALTKGSVTSHLSLWTLHDLALQGQMNQYPHWKWVMSLHLHTSIHSLPPSIHVTEKESIRILVNAILTFLWLCA